jgi:hypothetical protein
MYRKTWFYTTNFFLFLPKKCRNLKFLTAEKIHAPKHICDRIKRMQYRFNEMLDKDNIDMQSWHRTPMNTSPIYTVMKHRYGILFTKLHIASPVINSSRTDGDFCQRRRDTEIAPKIFKIVETYRHDHSLESSRRAFSDGIISFSIIHFLNISQNTSVPKVLNIRAYGLRHWGRL